MQRAEDPQKGYSSQPKQDVDACVCVCFVLVSIMAVPFRYAFDVCLSQGHTGGRIFFPTFPLRRFALGQGSAAALSVFEDSCNHMYVQYCFLYKTQRIAAAAAFEQENNHLVRDTYSMYCP